MSAESYPVRLPASAAKAAREETPSPPSEAPPERELDIGWVPFRAACAEREDVSVELFRRSYERARARREQQRP
jgi:hypothetical protein